MRNYFFIIILCCCITQSCSSQSEISRKEVPFKIIKKLSLEVDSLFPSTATGHYGILSNQFSGFDMIAPNLQLLLRFDTLGKLINSFGKSSLKENYILPNVVFPVGFDMHRDTTFLFYPNGEIFAFYQKKIVSKIQLKIPKGYIVARGTPFFYQPQQNTFLVSFGVDTDKAKDYFRLSNPFALLDSKKGNSIKMFGVYPKQYAQGHAIHGGMIYIEKLREQDNLYCMYSHFPVIYNYDFEGNLKRTFTLPEGTLRDTTFRVANTSWEDVPKKNASKYLNDAYRGGIAKAKGKNIFYYSFFSHSKKQEIICRYDADKKIFSEMNVSKANTFVRLFPLAKENSCFFLATNSQSDEVYIYEVAFE